MSLGNCLCGRARSRSQGRGCLSYYICTSPDGYQRGDTYAAADCYQHTNYHTVSDSHSDAGADCMGHSHTNAYTDAQATHTDSDTSSTGLGRRAGPL